MLAPSSITLDIQAASCGFKSGVLSLFCDLFSSEWQTKLVDFFISFALYPLYSLPTIFVHF
jgi:hypothetical protein